jgi:hypothetical protein
MPAGVVLFILETRPVKSASVAREILQTVSLQLVATEPSFLGLAPTVPFPTGTRAVLSTAVLPLALQDLLQLLLLQTRLQQELSLALGLRLNLLVVLRFRW